MVFKSLYIFNDVILLRESKVKQVDTYLLSFELQYFMRYLP
jgi:hypothetical protein